MHGDLLLGWHAAEPNRVRTDAQEQIDAAAAARDTAVQHAEADEGRRDR